MCCICYLLEEAGGTATVTPVQQMKSRLISNIFYLLSTYWILVVVGSFVLVFISGEPNLLKVVYLVFFLLFLATYQVMLYGTVFKTGLYYYNHTLCCCFQIS